jgi:hypothetical protein
MRFRVGESPLDGTVDMARLAVTPYMEAEQDPIAYSRLLVDNLFQFPAYRLSIALNR